MTDKLAQIKGKIDLLNERIDVLYVEIRRLEHGRDGASVKIGALTEKRKELKLLQEECATLMTRYFDTSLPLRRRQLDPAIKNADELLKKRG